MYTANDAPMTHSFRRHLGLDDIEDTAASVPVAWETLDAERKGNDYSQPKFGDNSPKESGD